MIHIEADSDAGGIGDAWDWTVSIMRCGQVLIVEDDAQLRPRGHDYVTATWAHKADCSECIDSPLGQVLCVAAEGAT